MAGGARMRIRILGGGWYGCHLALALLKRGHDVQLHEIADHLFAGASGGNPARLHLGFHYPRSRLTRAMCQDTHRDFMRVYGDLTRTIPVNVYAVAADRSLVDWGNYKQSLRGEIDFVELEKPEELGLQHIEGAALTGERHIVIRAARAFFERELRAHAYFGIDHREYKAVPPGFDWTIDCTFCARDAERIDRYEVCVTGLLRPTEPVFVPMAVTIMDGPFPSIYPWDPIDNMYSITSAQHTPIARAQSYGEALALLKQVTPEDARAQVEKMREQMRHYWPWSFDGFRPAGELIRIRAMPLSGADARLVDVVKTGDRSLRIRAGKIDAVMFAECQVAAIVEGRA
jgi:hypothetical protein